MTSGYAGVLSIRSELIEEDFKQINQKRVVQCRYSGRWRIL